MATHPARPRRARRAARDVVLPGPVLDDGLPDAPPQVALVKATDYVGNLLDLTEIVAALAYELLPSDPITIRSGMTVGETLGLSELSVLSHWNEQFGRDDSLFWNTLHDAVRQAGVGPDDTDVVLLVVRDQIRVAIAAADGPAAEVVRDLQVQLLALWLPQDSPWRERLPFETLLAILDFLLRFREILAAARAVEMPELELTWPLAAGDEDGWNIDVKAVVQVQIPQEAARLLSTEVTDDGVELHLRLDTIVLDDATGLALINPREHGRDWRFPIGGTVGDCTFRDLTLTVRIRGELAARGTQPYGPYHRYREAAYDEHDGDALVSFSLDVGSVGLDLNTTVLGATFAVATAVLDDPIGDIEDLLRAIEDLRDLGDVNRTVADALAPFFPGAVAVETHDLFEPFARRHVSVTYDGLYLEGSGRGLHVLNDLPEPDEPAQDPVPRDPDPDPIEPTGPLDELDPIPARRRGPGGEAARLVAIPQHFAITSSLAGSRGSAVDPFWVGLSVNAVAVDECLGVLVGSDTLAAEGTVASGGRTVGFRIDLDATAPTARVDLTGNDDHRPLVRLSDVTVHLDDGERAATWLVACEVPMEAVKVEAGCLPDDAVSAVALNAACVEELTDGEIAPQVYLEQLLYRHFVHLRFLGGEATIDRQTLVGGSAIQGLPTAAGRTAGWQPTTSQLPDVDPHVPVVDEQLLRAAMAETLAAAYTVPVLFDAFHERSPVIRSFAAADGWLNVYESYAGPAL